MQPLASIQEVDGAASSGFVSSSLLSCSAISSQVTAGPTRNVTGDVMPLVEAITQLSFLEFLQRCGVSIAPPQPSQLPVPISLLDAAVQTTPPCGASQDCPRRRLISRSPRYLLTWQCRRLPTVIHTSSLDAAVQTMPHSTLFQHVSTQMGSRSASSFSVDVFVQTPIRSTVLHDVAIQLPITGVLLLAVSSRAILWSAKTLFRQSPPSVQGPRAFAAASAGTRTARTAFRSCYWVALVHYTRRFCYSCTSTSPATFSYFSYASTAPCLYHPCGITSSTFSHYRQEKCQYRLGGNAQFCYYRFSCRVCSFS